MTLLLVSIIIGAVLVAVLFVPFVIYALAPLRSAHGVADNLPVTPGTQQVAATPGRSDARSVVGRTTVGAWALTAAIALLAVRMGLDWTQLTPWPWLALAAAYAVVLAVVASKWTRLDTRSARWNKRRGRWVRSGLASSIIGMGVSAAIIAFLLVLVLR